MRFVFYCPPAEVESAGLRAFRYLGDLVAKHCTDDGSDREPVAVYPDCIGPKNPLGLGRVIRFMFAPASWDHGFYGGGRIVRSDLVFVFDPWYYDDIAAHYDGILDREAILPIPCIEPGLFYPEEKTILAVLYVGKGTLPANVPPDWQIITRDSHPRPDAAALLRRAAVFITMDHYTMMAHEAELCRCAVWKADANLALTPYPTNGAQYLMDAERDRAVALAFEKRARDFFPPF